MVTLKKRLSFEGYSQIQYSMIKKTIVFKTIEFAQEFRYFTFLEPWVDALNYNIKKNPTFISKTFEDEEFYNSNILYQFNNVK